jgi:rhodanese-related sulfurtransferase
MRRGWLALALLGACSYVDDDLRPVAAPGELSAPVALPDRDRALAHKLVASGALLLDVRAADRHAAHHLDRAKNIPLEELAARLDEVAEALGDDKDKPIVIYCADGSRAAAAKRMLLAAGFTHVTNLGAMENWYQ